MVQIDHCHFCSTADRLLPWYFWSTPTTCSPTTSWLSSSPRSFSSSWRSWESSCWRTSSPGFSCQSFSFSTLGKHCPHSGQRNTGRNENSSWQISISSQNLRGSRSLWFRREEDRDLWSNTTTWLQLQQHWQILRRDQTYQKCRTKIRFDKYQYVELLNV